MRVHQIVTRLDAGDAISHQALAIHRLLTEWGFESRIFACGMDEYGKRFADYDFTYHQFASEPDDVLIYHYSIYNANHRLFLGSRNRKAIIYHNITPPEYHDRFYPETARLCRMGRDLLPRLRDCEMALGVSDFNRRELVEAGFEEEKTGVLSILPPLDKLDAVADDHPFARWLCDGKVNLLFVGRVVPNKKIEDLIKLFYCYHRGINARSRLVIVGSLLNTYYSALLSLVERMGLEERVFFLGKVSDAGLRSCYEHAHVYVSMSEHEGFCVPILEAFHFDIPVLAYAAGAVPETMGGAGILFMDKDYPLLAEMVDRIGRDQLLKERVVDAQRERLAHFDSSNFARALIDALGGVLRISAPVEEEEAVVSEGV